MMKRSWVAVLVALLMLGGGSVFLAACPAAPATTSPPTKKRDLGTVDSAMKTDSCGGTNESCCNGTDCDDNAGLTCRNGACCAKATASCQTSTECCQGMSCAGGTCCAIAATACIDSKDCCSGLLCTNGVCAKPTTATCDTAGAACCPGNKCASGFDCQNNACVACGTLGKACCGTTCNLGAGLTCNTTSKTCVVDCGVTGKPCCAAPAQQCTEAGKVCTGGICGGSTTGGGVGQDCIQPGNTCMAPFICVNKKCALAQTCNAIGQPCCGTMCNNGLSCGNDGKCAAATACPGVQSNCNTAAPNCCPALACMLTVQSSGEQPKNTCCVSAGTTCKGDLDCCGWLFCVGGTCTKNADGGDCVSNDDCINGHCDVATQKCGGSGSCAGMPVLGATCTNSGGSCCDGSMCRVLASMPGNNTCCRDKTQACDEDRDCCGKMGCNLAAKTCTCRPQASSCIHTSECCTGTCSGGICS